VTGTTAFAVNNFGDTRSGGLAGPMALLIIVLLAIATVLLIRNMNTRLRRLPDHFPGQDSPGQDGPGHDGPVQDTPAQDDLGQDRTERMEARRTDRAGQDRTGQVG
jgi:hypothetical protein